MKTTSAHTVGHGHGRRYETIRDVFDVTAYGISPAKLMLGADADGYVPGAKPPDTKQVSLVVAWLRECARRTKTVRRRNDSYSLRTQIVDWYRRKGSEVYVSNGAVIAAFLAEGYRAVRTRPEAPNAFFDMALL